MDKALRTLIETRDVKGYFEEKEDVEEACRIMANVNAGGLRGYLKRSMLVLRDKIC